MTISVEYKVEQAEIIRLAVVAAIIAYNTLAGTNVIDNGDWPTDPKAGPQIQVYDSHTLAVSQSRANPNFTTTTYITVSGRAASDNLPDARKIRDVLDAQIKQAVLTDFGINKMLQQFTTVTSAKKVNSESGMHVAEVTVEFACEYYQDGDDYTMPVNPEELKQITVSMDLTNVFDAAGTYTGTLFPDAIKDAPRTSGPDGRNEGFIDVDLEQLDT